MIVCNKISKKQRGVAIIELAISLFFLLLVTIGITEIGRAFWYYNAIQKATRDAARYLSMQPWDTSGDPVGVAQTMVQNNAVSAGVPAEDANGTALENTVQVTGFTGGWGSGGAPEYITVTVNNYRMHWLWSLGAPLPQPGGNSGLRVQTTMPYMR